MYFCSPTFVNTSIREEKIRRDTYRIEDNCSSTAKKDLGIVVDPPAQHGSVIRLS